MENFDFNSLPPSAQKLAQVFRESLISLFLSNDGIDFKKFYEKSNPIISNTYKTLRYQSSLKIDDDSANSFLQEPLEEYQESAGKIFSTKEELDLFEKIIREVIQRDSNEYLTYGLSPLPLINEFLDFYENKFTYSISERVNNDTDIEQLDIKDHMLDTVLTQFMNIELALDGSTIIETDPALYNPFNTGYLLPHFGWLSLSSTYDELTIREAYLSLLPITKLEDDNNLVDVEYISSRRDVIEKQLEKQLSYLEKLNDGLLNIIASSYCQAQDHILLKQKLTGPDQHKKSITKDWFYVLVLFKQIADFFFLNINDNELFEHHKSQVSSCPYVPSSSADLFCSVLDNSFEKKKPYLEVTRTLAIDLLMCESIIEDILMRKPTKTFEQLFSQLRLQTLPDPKHVAQKFTTRQKNKEYNGKPLSLITQAMEKTREYIHKNNPATLIGLVSDVARFIEPIEADSTTIYNYIHYYAEKAGIPSRKKKKK